MKVLVQSAIEAGNFIHGDVISMEFFVSVPVFSVHCHFLQKCGEGTEEEEMGGLVLSPVSVASYCIGYSTALCRIYTK